ncbi:MAG TPA: hypothetical protein VN449_11640, partial [Gaiellaceae bacterium]|nr:hypothetical protein [Gaiellaceae bacterium]
ARAADRSGPPELVEFANWMLDTPKVVFSTGVARASMKNSRIASRPIADEVAHLRGEAGGTWSCLVALEPSMHSSG